MKSMFTFSDIMLKKKQTKSFHFLMDEHFLNENKSRREFQSFKMTENKPIVRSHVLFWKDQKSPEPSLEILLSIYFDYTWILRNSIQLELRWVEISFKLRLFSKKKNKSLELEILCWNSKYFHRLIKFLSPMFIKKNLRTALSGRNSWKMSMKIKIKSLIIYRWTFPTISYWGALKIPALFT